MPSPVVERLTVELLVDVAAVPRFVSPEDSAAALLPAPFAAVPLVEFLEVAEPPLVAADFLLPGSLAAPGADEDALLAAPGADEPTVLVLPVLALAFFDGGAPFLLDWAV